MFGVVGRYRWYSRHRGLYFVEFAGCIQARSCDGSGGWYIYEGRKRGKKTVFVSDADVSRRVVQSRNAVAASRRAAAPRHCTSPIILYII